MRLRKVLRVDWAARAALPGRVRGRGCPKRVELDKLSPPGVWGPGTRRAREQTAQETRHFRVLDRHASARATETRGAVVPSPPAGSYDTNRRRRGAGVQRLVDWQRAAGRRKRVHAGQHQPTARATPGLSASAGSVWARSCRQPQLGQCPRPPSGSWAAPTARPATIQGIGRATRRRGARASAPSRPTTSM